MVVEQAMLDKVRLYMREVSRHISEGCQPPAGYLPDDKDMGYRSALRWLGLKRTAESDLVAREMIYGVPADSGEPRGQQLELF